jgi:hypothetical protein
MRPLVMPVSFTAVGADPRLLGASLVLVARDGRGQTVTGSPNFLLPFG